MLNALILSFAAAGAHASLQVVPGATWTATNTGHHVQAHGAGIIEDSGTFYMIGEDKSGGSAFQNINCYSSTNLVEWKFENALLSLQDDGDLGPNRVVERPKVIYNEGTGTYVMYLHIDDSSYAEAKVGVATSQSVCGDYSYIGSSRPLDFESRDIGLFKDDDGSAYLLTEDRPNGLRIDALSDDYLNVTESVYLWNKSIEAPAVWKANGYYFMFGSLLTGWDPNDNVYSFAESLSGPWSEWTGFATSGSKTYQSQTNFILPWGDSAIYMGDRWQPSNLMRSTYVWLPLEVAADNKSSIFMEDRERWVPDAAARTWGVGPTETQYEGEDATLANGAKAVDCSGCSQGKAAGYLGGDDGGSLEISDLNSDDATRSTVRIQYANGDSTERFATVSVNGVDQTIAFLPSEDGQTPGTSVVNCDVKAGGSNTIIVKGAESGYAADVDAIFVPVS